MKAILAGRAKGKLSPFKWNCPSPTAKIVNPKNYHNPGGIAQTTVTIKYLKVAEEVIPGTLMCSSCLAGAETRWVLENAIDYREVGHMVIPVAAAVPDGCFYWDRAEAPLVPGM